MTEYARQTGVQLLYSAQLAEPLTANAIKGRYTPQQALERLLEGSGISYRTVDGNVITLEIPKTGSLSTETLLAAAGEFKLVKAEPEEKPWTGPVEQLDMKVIGGDLSRYIEVDSTAGSKIPMETVRVPQSIQVITENAFKDQGTQSIGDIMKQVPSATVFGSRYARFPKVNIRGFQADQVRNGIRQEFLPDTNDFSALSHVQSVEILKGPGSTIFGQGGNGGGVINIVTKRPYDRFGAEVSFTRGGWDQFDGDMTSGQWDFNAPLTPDGALKARFTGEIEGTDTFINFQDLNRENFGLALSWDNGGPVRGFINAEYQHRQGLSIPGLPAIGTVQDSGGLGRVSRDTFLGEPRFDNMDTELPRVQAWLEIDVGENWKVSPRFQYWEVSVRQDQTFLNATTLNPVNGSIDVSRSGRDFLERDRDFIGQIDITGTIDTGPLKHQIFLCGDYTNHHFNGGFFPRINVPSINALDPIYLDTDPVLSTTKLNFGGNYEVGAVAFQDIISITSRFDLMGGVRHSRVSGKRKIVTGKVTETDTDNTIFQGGGTFHVTDSVHLFAGYGEGFNVADAVGFGTASGRPFDLGQSEQVEAGIKVNFPWGLTGTASYFDITRTNVSTPDRANPGFQVQTGEIRSKGAEVELAYQITDQWFVQGGYAFIDAKITKSNAGDVGNRFQNTPEHQANFWTHYRFDSGLLENLTLSTGVNFVGNRLLDNANTIQLPNFTTWDLGASYTYQNMKLELFANNVLDKRYFVANDSGPTVMPGEPRSIVGRISLAY
ncbi:TonB-dependent receptor [Methylotuvimicrobium sp. KM2]|uniref:TonB-dependent siderophore receptor n=1 Tax=Methylotuvimicrobium sp. KM2 TaxID=3133976 RepID=UPI003100E06D